MQASGAFSRMSSAALLLGSGAVLGVARWLEPSPLGHGTHLQLGLGQCSFLGAVGVPCPMCGATTSFSLMAHLRPIDALITQPFAVLLFVLTVGVFALSAAEVVAPRARWSRLSRALGPWDPVVGGGFLIAMGLGWAYKIATWTT